VLGALAVDRVADAKALAGRGTATVCGAFGPVPPCVDEPVVDPSRPPPVNGCDECAIMAGVLLRSAKDEPIGIVVDAACRAASVLICRPAAGVDRGEAVEPEPVVAADCDDDEVDAAPDPLSCDDGAAHETPAPIAITAPIPAVAAATRSTITTPE
jgi:hypothetical protein